MDLTFVGRGLPITDELREAAHHKLSKLERIEPRVQRIDLEFSSEHHRTFDGIRRVEASLRIPRKTFRASMEATDVQASLDGVADKLERQLRDHHGRRRTRFLRPRRSLKTQASPADTPE
jgi:putative sigma-54 modulation protein